MWSFNDEVEDDGEKSSKLFIQAISCHLLPLSLQFIKSIHIFLTSSSIIIVQKSSESQEEKEYIKSEEEEVKEEGSYETFSASNLVYFCRDHTSFIQLFKSSALPLIASVLSPPAESIISNGVVDQEEEEIVLERKVGNLFSDYLDLLESHIPLFWNSISSSLLSQMIPYLSHVSNISTQYQLTNHPPPVDPSPSYVPNLLDPLSLFLEKVWF